MKTSPHHNSDSPGYPAHKGLTAAHIALLAGMVGLTPSCDRSDNTEIELPPLTFEEKVGKNLGKKIKDIIEAPPQENTFPVTPGQTVIEPNAAEAPANQADQQDGDADEVIFHTKGKIHVVPDDPAPAEKDANVQHSQAVKPDSIIPAKPGEMRADPADKPNSEAIIPAPDEYTITRGDIAVEPTAKE